MRKALSLLLSVLIILSLFGCMETENSEEKSESTVSKISDEADESEELSTESDSAGGESWAVYWYVCGSDLESKEGHATEDLAELTSVQLPENVQFIIETGGASQWQNDLVDADKLQCYQYNSEGIGLVAEQPSASMGEAGTLADFLSFAYENYPADKIAVIIWNHGGGSVSGVAFDELFDDDSLKIDEMHEAFDSAFKLDSANPPVDLIGFDACLMSTVDVAASFSDTAKYLVASEEIEPGNGWQYSGIAAALAENPAMDGAELGKEICDSFYSGCEETETQDEVTLALTDLSKVSELMNAYENFGNEALLTAAQDSGFISRFGRVAAKSENYGGNTKVQGFSNMVDLGHLARQSADMLDSSEDVIKALEDCVIYKVSGKYRLESTGLSCYYSYNGDKEDFEEYKRLGAGKAFKSFFSYELYGEPDGSGLEYLSQTGLDEIAELNTLSSMNWEGIVPELSDDGVAYLDLGAKAGDVLAGIGFTLYRMNYDDGTVMLLGTDNDINSDWENGTFSDNFRGVWGGIDGSMVYMALDYEGEDYNLYSVPVLLNGEEYNLQVAYSYSDESWSILGARQGISDEGMADKNMRILQDGDEITILWYMSSADSEDLVATEADTVIYSDDTTFSEVELSDGSYYMTFMMWDALGYSVDSSGVTFDCDGGEITTTVEE